MARASGPADGHDGTDQAPDLDSRIGLPEDVRATFERLPAATVCLRGPEHVVVAANAAYRAAMGKEQMIGLPVTEAIPELAGQMAFEMVDRVWATGRPEVQREWRIEVNDADGRPTEIFVDFTGTPYAGADGEVEGIIFSAEVVTERALRRRETAAQEARTRHALLEAREVVASLQHAMLPSGLPVLPEVDLAAAYLVAGTGYAAGGDWFDAVPLGDGRVALAVGDVVGHGVEASAVMSGLRAVLASALASTRDLGTAMQQLDRYAGTVAAAHAATVCVAVMDPRSTHVTYCTAGHPPPLVVDDDGATFAAPSGARPLVTGGDLSLAHLRVPRGAALVLYSDGLVERPGRSPAQATVDLARVVSSAHRGEAPGAAHVRLAERLCTTTVELLVRETGHADDVTILAAHRLDRAVDEVDVVMPASPSAIQDARVETAVLIESHHLSHTSALSFHHAVSELVTNVVEHAYRDGDGRDGPGRVRLQAGLTDDGCLRAVVSDQGRWRHRDPEHRGLGLRLVERMADHLVVTRGTSDHPGTTVTVEVAARRGAHLLGSDRPSPAAQPGTGTFSVEVHEDDGENSAATRVVVRGPVDLRAVDRLRAALVGTAGGPHDVVLDLTEVTLLSSRGVQLLDQLAAAPVTGPRLWVHAPPGTPAAHVLDLTHLEVQRLPAEGRRDV